VLEVVFPLANEFAGDVLGFGRLIDTDEDRSFALLRGLRSDLIHPAIAAHRGASSSAPTTTALPSFAAWSTVQGAPGCNTATPGVG